MRKSREIAEEAVLLLRKKNITPEQIEQAVSTIEGLIEQLIDDKTYEEFEMTMRDQR